MIVCDKCFREGIENCSRPVIAYYLTAALLSGLKVRRSAV